MSRRPAATFSLTLLPFLDIIVSLIGIFIVVFALQEVVESQAGRQAATDHLLICTDGNVFLLYSLTDPKPQSFDLLQTAALFETLAAQPGIRNLTVALSGNCFAARDLLAQTFEQFLQTRRDNERRPTLRLNYRPLSARPEAVAELLAQWRGDRHGQQ